jgi:membrane protein required for colicin V production
MAPEIITDIVVIGIILVSGLLALFQGLVKEVLSIAAWVGAIYATIYGFAPARPIVKDIVPWPEAVDLATGTILFIGSLILLSIGAHLISKILHSAGAGVLDRTLGFVFGLFRGVLMVVVLFIGISWYVSNADQPRWFANSRTLPLTASAATYLVSVAPEDIRKVLPKIVQPQRHSDAGGTPDSLKTSRPGYPSADRRSMERLIQGAGQGK